MSGRNNNTKKQPRYQRIVQLNAVTDMDDGVDNDADADATPVVPQRRTYTKGAPTPVVSSLPDDTLLPGESYAYFWTLPIIRTYATWIGIAAIVLLVLDFAVFIMWLIGRIPGLPSSTMYYGFILYFLFILAGIVSLFVSCSTEKIMYTLTLVIVFVSFILAIFINILIVRTISDCANGVIPPACGDFYLTQIVLLLISIAIAIDLFILLILFAIMFVRIGQTYSTVDYFYQ